MNEMLVTSKKNPVIIYKARSISDPVSAEIKVELTEVKTTIGEPIENPKTKEIAISTFKRLYRDINSGDNSMRANRSGRSGRAKPFMPKPYRLRQSMISSYLQCPDKFYATFEDGYSESSIFTKMGTAIHGIMEDFYDINNTRTVDELFQSWWTQHGPEELSLYEEWRGLIAQYFAGLENKPKPNIIARELEFVGQIREIPISGTIDRIDRIDDNTIMIVDYKTNMMPYTAEELQSSIQFKFYSLAVQQLKETLGDFNTVICAYEMMRTGQRQTVVFHVEQLEVFTDWLEVIWAKMLSGRDRNPKINKYCGYCQRRENCQLYQQFLENPLSIVGADNESVEEELTRLKETMKIIKGRVDELEGTLKNAIVEAGGAIQINGREWSLQTSQRVTYPFHRVLDILESAGRSEGCSDYVEALVSNANSLSANAIKKLKLPDYIVAELDAIKQVGFTNPSLKSKAIKEVK